MDEKIKMALLCQTVGYFSSSYRDTYRKRVKAG